MIEYIIKIILCSAMFLLVYFIFLEKEKMYRFSRFYLLFSIVFSLIVPSITIQIEKNAPLQTMSEFISAPDEIISDTNLPQEISANATATSHLNKESVLLLVYCIITAFLLIMFIKNLFKIYSKIKGKEYVSYNSSRIILTNENLTPHSFLNCMFLNKTVFEKGEIEEEILCHELTHIKQYHTIDVLLIELITVFFWFNPFVFLYKRAIKLNHEFLADEGVINKFQNISAYKYLLIRKTSQQKSFAITSQFNFLITKKRLVMITKYTSLRMAFLKQCLVITVLIIAVFVFSSKSIIAQELKDTIPPITKSSSEPKDTSKLKHLSFYAGGTKEGVSQELLTEYQNIINTIKPPEISWLKFGRKIPESDRRRLETIFMQMNFNQQQQQTIIFMRPSPPLPRVVPTEKQFDAFKNGKIYGVWLNDKKVANNELNNYTAKDFAQVFVSKLFGAAKKNKSYSYQVNLMTKDYYQAYYNGAIADKSNTIGFRVRRVGE